MAKLVAPLSYNFLLLIKCTDTQFNQVMKSINLTPIFGKGFATYVPLLLVVFVFMNFFNIHTKLMSGLGMSQFSFGDHFDAEKLLEGKTLIAKFRAEKERNTGYNPTNGYSGKGGYFAKVASQFGSEEVKSSFASQARSEMKKSIRSTSQYEDSKKKIPEASEPLRRGSVFVPSLNEQSQQSSRRGSIAKPKRDIYDF